ISTAANNEPPFSIPSGSQVTLTLISSNTLTSTATGSGNNAGISVPSGATLLVNSPSDGLGSSLNVTGGGNSAGIGGGGGTAAGSITIGTGATITTINAKGGTNGAGVGGSGTAAGGTVALIGQGHLTATGGTGGTVSAAGVGGGADATTGSALSIAVTSSLVAYSQTGYAIQTTQAVDNYFMNARFVETINAGNETDFQRFPSPSRWAGTGYFTLPANYRSFAYTTGSATSKTEVIDAYIHYSATKLGDVVIAATNSPLIPSVVQSYAPTNPLPVKLSNVINIDICDSDGSLTTPWHIGYSYASNVLTFNTNADGVTFRVWQNTDTSYGNGAKIVLVKSIVVVNAVENLPLTLDTVNISHDTINLPPLSILGNSQVTLTLAGTSTLENTNGTAGNNAGISVPSGTTLIVGGSGTLNANGGASGAGIGGGNATAGSVTINGGTINAKGGANGAGIGGGGNGAAGALTINGGTVNATGGTNAAGIGGANGGAAGTLNIASAATVRAYAIGVYPGIQVPAGGNAGNGFYVNAKLDTGITQAAALKVYANGGASSANTLNLPAGYRCFAYTTGATATQNDNIFAFNAAGTTLLGTVVRFTGDSPLLASVNTVAVLDVKLLTTLAIDLDNADSSLVRTGLGYGFTSGTHTLAFASAFTGISYRIYQSGTNTLAPGGAVTSIQVDTGVTLTATIAGLTVTSGTAGTPPFKLSGTASATLTLEGTSSFISTATASGDNAGMLVPSGTTLALNGTGSLTATGGLNSAGIGGGNNASGGTITISGVTLIANGGTGGAGIGGGLTTVAGAGNGGSITISGGHVTANGGTNGGAGIGGGSSDSVAANKGSSGTVIIEGGTVIATGGGNGAGIGGGWRGAGTSISVRGSAIVTANGGANGAGIGGGSGGAGGAITISATPNITAKGGAEGAAIGGGNGGAGGTITISSGTVTATGGAGSVGTGGGAGIGGGNGGAAASLSIDDAAVVTAYAYATLPALHESAANLGDGYFVNATFNAIVYTDQNTSLKVYENNGASSTKTLTLPTNYRSFAYVTGAAARNDRIFAYNSGGSTLKGPVVRVSDSKPQLGSVKSATALEVKIGTTIDIDLDNADGSLLTTGFGYGYATQTLSFNTAANGLSYTIYQSSGNQYGPVRSIQAATGVTTNITINGITVTSAIVGTPPFKLTGSANISLTVTGTNSLVHTATATGDNAGILVPSTATLTLSGAGTLTATGGGYSAGIGGGNSGAGGSITLSGTGTVNANGGVNGGAGIGGGAGGAGGTITVSSGTVNATGGSDAGNTGVGGGAGIGGGLNGDIGTITLNGGTVTANAPSSNGIGSGKQYSASATGSLSIGSGATVLAFAKSSLHRAINAGSGGNAGTANFVNATLVDTTLPAAASVLKVYADGNRVTLLINPAPTLPTGYLNFAYTTGAASRNDNIVVYNTAGSTPLGTLLRWNSPNYVKPIPSGRASYTAQELKLTYNIPGTLVASNPARTPAELNNAIAMQILLTNTGHDKLDGTYHTDSGYLLSTTATTDTSASYVGAKLHDGVYAAWPAAWQDTPVAITRTGLVPNTRYYAQTVLATTLDQKRTTYGTYIDFYTPPLITSALVDIGTTVESVSLTVGFYEPTVGAAAISGVVVKAGPYTADGDLITTANKTVTLTSSDYTTAGLDELEVDLDFVHGSTYNIWVTVTNAGGLSDTYKFKYEAIDTILSASIPIKMIFAAFNVNSGRISSPLYHITNESTFPMSVYLSDFAVVEPDGLTLTQNPVSAGQLGLKLEGHISSPTFGTGYLPLGSNLGLALASTTAPLAAKDETGSTGYFRIGGLYKGLFDIQRAPKFNATFKLDLVIPDPSP
ncbi:MAG: hypothetical protein LBT60_07555, partial [Oscillospiraceae bacterium]|nr:hypothetical protein [Oscillospiraceae bacterium]